jgi:hypothetical protein
VLRGDDVTDSGGWRDVIEERSRGESSSAHLSFSGLSSDCEEEPRVSAPN